MTIPFQNLPDTRPGYAFQNPGDIGALGGGLEAVIAALLQRKRLEQQQQELGIQQQMANQSAQYQQGQLAQGASRLKAEKAARLATLMGDRQVGSGLQAMMQGMTVPGVGQLQPLSMGEASQMVAPENVPELMKQGAPIQKDQEAKAEKARQQKAQQALLKTLPKELQGPAAAMFQARSTGVDDASSRQLMGALAGTPSPELLAQIDKAHPEWANLSGPERRDLWMKEQEERINLRFSPSQQGGGAQAVQKVPPTVKTAYETNGQTVKVIDDLLRAYGADPNDDTGANDHLVNPGKSYSVWNRLTLGARPEFARVVGKKGQTDIQSMIGRVRTSTMFNEAGKQLTPGEKVEVTVFQPDINNHPRVNVSNLRAMKRWLKGKNEGMQSSYPSDRYEPLATTPDAGGDLQSFLESIPGFKKR